MTTSHEVPAWEYERAIDAWAAIVREAQYGDDVHLHPEDELAVRQLAAGIVDQLEPARAAVILAEPHPGALIAVGLTFADLAAANRARCQRWHPGYPDDETWSGADWSNALGGEAGELAEAALAIVAYVGKLQNTVKKIRRYETGTNTAPDKPIDQLWDEFDAEMADVACYLDLLATKYGRDLAGAIAAKFNTVSERQGFPERLPGAR